LSLDREECPIYISIPSKLQGGCPTRPSACVYTCNTCVF
jgi:hypothetical protein